MDHVRRLLADAIEKEEKEEKKRIDLIKASFPVFKNEDEALAYAKRVASLKPGDIVMTSDDDATKLNKAAFIRWEDGEAIILMPDEGNAFILVRTGANGILLPD